MTMAAAAAPRSALRLVTGAFGLYRRYPLLFLVLAAGVIVPYEVIVLVATGKGTFAQSSLSFGVSSLLTLVEWVLIGPLISALHVHAVREAREGREPELAPIARQGLRVLPVVAAASIISGLGIGLGFVALIVPGFILLLRWHVVAQAAAIENQGWQRALDHSRYLVQGHYRHVLVFVVYVVLIVTVPTLLFGLAFGHHSTTVASFLVGVTVQLFTRSFGALATALLYFDLRARHESLARQGSAGDPGLPGSDPPATGHSQDPRSYSDQDRPKGWYIDPSDPSRMRYWSGDDSTGWAGSTSTPRKIRRAWREKDQGR
jgi:hypothetical protein